MVSASSPVQETRRLLDTVLSIQPRVATAGGGKSTEDVILELAADIKVGSLSH